MSNCVVPTASDSTGSSSDGKNNIIVISLIVGGVVIAMVIIVCVYCVNMKKKKEIYRSSSQQANIPMTTLDAENMQQTEYDKHGYMKLNQNGKQSLQDMKPDI